MFLDCDVELRRVMYDTNAVEWLNARCRRAVAARRPVPNEQAAMTCLYPVTRSLDPNNAGETGWVVRYEPALYAFAVTFVDRMPVAETN